MKLRALVVLFALLLAFVVPTGAHASATGLFDRMVDSYSASSTVWLGRTTHYARNLFAILAALELVVFATLYVMSSSGKPLAVLEKLILLAVLQALLTYYPIWLPKIIFSFQQIGQTASGTTTLSPSGIVDLGITLVGLLNLYLIGPLLSNPLGTYLGALGTFILLAAFVAIAIRLTALLIESYVLLGGTFIAAGFASNRFTATITDNWIAAFVRLGIEIMLTYALVSPGYVLASTFAATLSNPTLFIPLNLRPMFELIAVSWLWAYIVWTIPG